MMLPLMPLVQSFLPKFPCKVYCLKFTLNFLDVLSKKN